MITASYTAVRSILAWMRQHLDSVDRDPDTRVITVRMPARLHAAIADAAHLEGVSMNRWCIAVLIEGAKGCVDEWEQTEV